jgi:hypothetical protein
MQGLRKTTKKQDNRFLDRDLNTGPPEYCFHYAYIIVFLDDLAVFVFAIGPKFFGLKPDRGRWVFKSDKNWQHAFLLTGSKAVGPMS